MTGKSKIEWTEKTWNPVTGCTKVGPGCDRCYAERFAERWRGVINQRTGKPHPYFNGFDLTLRPDRLDHPLRWSKPSRIFVNSMSDLFHKDIPDGFIDAVFETMEAADWHQFQVLTKRSTRMRDYVNRRYKGRGVPPQIWFGVSVEDVQRVSRIKHLQCLVGAAVRFVSFEPLLGPIPDPDLSGIHWAIVGGESGPGHRPIKADRFDGAGKPTSSEWIRMIRNSCRVHGTAFFFKQWGGHRPTDGGHELDGKVCQDYPERPTLEPSLFGDRNEQPQT